MIRLDVFLNEKQGIGRESAKELIKSGKILVDGKICIKPSQAILPENSVEIISGEEYKKYVSRGGYKLEKAIEVFSLDFKNKDILDVGSSTGGFTDCALKNNANSILAIDTGTNQMHESLKNNHKITLMENTNILDLHIEKNFDFVLIDVSFVSLKKIAPFALNFLKEKGYGVFLIKPQFEVGQGFINKKGVVKNEKIIDKLIRDFYLFFEDLGYRISNLCPSPIKGHMGNQEYLILVEKVI